MGYLWEIKYDVYVQGEKKGLKSCYLIKVV